MRLVDGGSRCAGRVEIKYQEEWGQLSSGYSSMKYAAVVCRQLDCGSAVSTRGYRGDEDRPVWWFYSHGCAGTESALRECGYVRGGGRISSFVIEVICSGNTHNVVIFTWGSW